MTTIRRQTVGVVDPALTADQFVPTGGLWSGLLFETPGTEVPAQLTWTFTFEFQPIGDATPSLVVDGVSFSRSNWRNMARRTASSDAFGEPIESSVYYVSHHRYDTAHVEITNQRRSEARVQVRLAGDLDALGIPEFVVDGWLEFEGIIVQLGDEVTGVASARARLAEFTDVEGLVGDEKGLSYLFRPGFGS